MLCGLSRFLLLIPIFLCGFARTNQSWGQGAKRGASDETQQSTIPSFQFLLIFTTAIAGGPTISPLHDGICTSLSHQDHLSAALTNKPAHCRPIWHLRIKIPQAFAFDESQPRYPHRSSCPTADLLLPKANRLTIPLVSLFHKRQHYNGPVCMSHSWQVLLDHTIFQATEAGKKSSIDWLIAPPPTDFKSTNYALVLCLIKIFYFFLNTTVISGKEEMGGTYYRRLILK